MKKYDIVISHLNETDLAFLNLFGVYVNERIYQNEWELIIKMIPKDIFLNLNNIVFKI